MMTELQVAMTAGVFVEFHDRQGNTVGQAVFAGWQGRPIPGVGDTMCCSAQSPTSGRREKLVGQVTSRHFELQHADGEPCVRVRLALTVAAAQRRTREVTFSSN